MSPTYRRLFSSRYLVSRSLKSDRGFSLVEVVMSLGIVSFCFLGLVGLLPVGLNNFNSSIDSTVAAQITQSVVSKVRQAKFSELAKLPEVSYFDAQGGTPSGVGANNYVYRVDLTAMSTAGVDGNTMSPAASWGPVNPTQSVARITVKVRKGANPDVTAARQTVIYVANSGS